MRFLLSIALAVPLGFVLGLLSLMGAECQDGCSTSFKSAWWFYEAWLLGWTIPLGLLAVWLVRRHGHAILGIALPVLGAVVGFLASWAVIIAIVASNSGGE